MATHRRVEKDMIALSIINVIAKRNGRFLQRVRPSANQATVGEGPSDGRPPPVWKIADRDVVTEKVKQALRDKDSAADVQDETAPIPTAPSHSSIDAAYQQRTSPILPQASLDPPVSHVPGYGISPLLSSMYPFPGLAGQPYPRMHHQHHPSLAFMIQQIERERQLAALLQLPYSFHPALDPRGLSTGMFGPMPYASSAPVGNDSTIDQLLRQQRLRHQEMLLRGQQLPSDVTTVRETNPNPTDNVAGNLKRDEDDEQADDASSETVKRGKDSSPDSDKNDALKEYADLLSVGLTTSSSSPDHPKKKRNDSSSTSDQQSQA